MNSCVFRHTHTHTHTHIHTYTHTHTVFSLCLFSLPHGGRAGSKTAHVGPFVGPVFINGLMENTEVTQKQVQNKM